MPSADMDDATGDKEVVYENTYITSPEGYGKDAKFSAKKVKEILVEILNSKFEGMAYDQSQVSLLTKELSETIREKVKELKYTRYKTVVEVTIGQKVGQAIRQTSRCLWDTKSDTYASERYENESLFCVIQVYGLYHE